MPALPQPGTGASAPGPLLCGPPSSLPPGRLPGPATLPPGQVRLVPGPPTWKLFHPAPSKLGPGGGVGSLRPERKQD